MTDGYLFIGSRNRFLHEEEVKKARLKNCIFTTQNNIFRPTVGQRGDFNVQGILYQDILNKLNDNKPHTVIKIKKIYIVLRTLQH